jgi:hypothetical protein
VETVKTVVSSHEPLETKPIMPPFFGSRRSVLQRKAMDNHALLKKAGITAGCPCEKLTRSNSGDTLVVVFGSRRRVLAVKSHAVQ